MTRHQTADLEPTFFGGRYTLLRRLAVGGMAEIYLARQAAMAGFEKEVVIKRLRAELADDPRIVEMFLDEAKIGAQLNHPNIVHVYDVDEHDGIPYIAMEYIVGEELNELCRRGISHGRFLPLEHAVELIRQAAAGMGYFHAKRGAEGSTLAERAARHRAPRHLADQPARHAGRLPEGDRLRHRAVARPADAQRRATRQAQLHVARAGGAQTRRSSQRRVLARHRAVRDHRRQAPVSRARARGRAQADRRRRRAADVRAPQLPAGARVDRDAHAREAPRGSLPDRVRPRRRSRSVPARRAHALRPGADRALPRPVVDRRWWAGSARADLRGGLARERQGSRLRQPGVRRLRARSGRAMGRRRAARYRRRGGAADRASRSFARCARPCRFDPCPSRSTTSRRRRPDDESGRADTSPTTRISKTRSTRRRATGLPAAAATRACADHAQSDDPATARPDAAAPRRRATAGGGQAIDRRGLSAAQIGAGALALARRRACSHWQSSGSSRISS